MLTRFPRCIPVAVVLSSLVLGPGAGQQLSDEWREAWIEDLEFVRAEVPARHVDAFHTMTPAAWNREIDLLIERLPRLRHHEIVVELTRIIAGIGDGHTRLTLPLAAGVDFPQGHSSTPAPAISELVFHAYPVRFGVDAEGLYVAEVGRRHAAALGARVLRVGDVEADEAMALLEPTIRRDNAMQVMHHLPMHLALAEMLHARGITPTKDRLTLLLAQADGSRRELRLRVLPEGSTVDWVRLTPGSEAATLSASGTDDHFWFRYLPRHRAVYLQFNQVNDSPEETVREFARRLEERLREARVDRLIVDLRRNRGGNSWLGRSVVRAIVRGHQERVGQLFVLIGRSTFSAAMTFALELERYTKALFVGEPTGARPNSYGDSRRIHLPNTNLTIRASTRYHQNDFTDNRASLAPDIPVRTSRLDRVQGRDPVLETVLELVAQPPVAPGPGRWRGRAKFGLNTVEMSLEWNAPDSSGGRVDADGGGESPRLTVMVPDLGIDGAEARDVMATHGELSFTLDTELGAIPFVAQVRRGWVLGRFVGGGIEFPFALRRTNSEEHRPVHPARDTTSG